MNTTVKKFVCGVGLLVSLNSVATVLHAFFFFLVMACMQEFPNEGIATVVRNVFDFDSFHPELLEVVFKVLHKHGIPVGASASAVQLAPE